MRSLRGSVPLLGYLLVAFAAVKVAAEYFSRGIPSERGLETGRALSLVPARVSPGYFPKGMLDFTAASNRRAGPFGASVTVGVVLWR